MIQKTLKNNVLTLFGFVVFVGLIYLEIFKITSISDSIAYWSSIISLCSFLGLLYTVKLQMNEMIDNRKEFQIMNFNDIFFNLINAQNQIKNSIKYQSIKGGYNPKAEHEIIVGDTFFDNAMKDIEIIFDLRNEDKSIVSQIPENFNLVPIENKYLQICLFYNIEERELKMIKRAENLSVLIPTVMLIFVSKHQKSFLHYITHLENLLDVVINNAPKDSTYNYCNYIKSQLTSSELTFLYYICHLRDNLMGSLKVTQILKAPVHQFISDEHHEYFREVFK